MPAKNSVKEYQPGAYYHIYNRGVEKRDIFLDPQDYKVFISYLASHLSPPDLQEENLKVSPSRKLKNYYDTINLICYCLMPNHYHLLLQQTELYTIAEFTKSVCTKYSMYFNRKYKRVGSLFQGPYKAVKIESEQQLVYLTKYIHLNPSGLHLVGELYPYSSLGHYLHSYNQTWINASSVLELFNSSSEHNSYKAFLSTPPPDMGQIDPITLIDSDIV